MVEMTGPLTKNTGFTLKFIFALQDMPVHTKLENEQVGEEVGTVDEPEKMPEDQRPTSINKHLSKNHTHQLVSLVKTISEPCSVLRNKRGPNIVFMTYQNR
jgi:hypothetical protein